MGTHMLQKSLLAAILATITGSAFAAGPVANLKIDGRVTPPTCTINGADQGELIAEFDAVTPSWLKESGTGIQFGSERTIPMTINCDALTYMTFVATDTYSAAGAIKSGNSDSESFSALVATDKTTSGVGITVTEMNNMKVDGKTAYFGRQTSKYTYTSLNRIVPGAITAWTTEQQMNVDPKTFKMAAGKTFAADMFVRNFLYSRAEITAKGINLTEQVDYVGETVLTFNFGI